jgi:hypothetical protein
MRIRSIAPHANPFGCGRGKPVGTEYEAPADEARALIAAKLAVRIDGKKPVPAAAKNSQKTEAPKKD